jgi:ribosomal protein S12 methylthiotransferase
MVDKTFHLVSLGCAKNTVDSESMAQILAGSGYRAVEKANRASVLIVNTCGFIGPAKEESLRVLGELAAGKRPGQVLIAAGCLTQRYGVEVARRVPGIDGILGTRRWMDILDVVKQLRKSPHPEPVYHLPETPSLPAEEQGVLRAAVQGASAYLKIADGCRRPCAFCAIPLIKGTAVSRPPEAILAEARSLQAMGVRELNLIAQDTTDYGHDLGIKDGLAYLLEQLVTSLREVRNGSTPTSGVDWIRILYAYPGYVTDRLIEVMASSPQIVPYLDMPLQHAHPDTLRRMRRPANVEWVYHTLEKMRAAMPELALRTTFIVGYPGETEAEFQALLDFVQDLRFDRVGAFQFSFEPGTTSEPLGDPLPAELKQERYDRLMALQQGISLEKNQAFVGRTLDVLIEGQGDGLSLGRSYRDAPEIDGLTIIEGEVPTGELVPVRITGALAYDLTGLVETNPKGIVIHV